MKSYCDKSTAKRGFIRMGGDAVQFENTVKLVNGKWQFDDSCFPKKCKKITFHRVPNFPKVDMSQHKTGAALIAHIKAFDKSRCLAPGNRYHIGGQEVMI